MPSFTERVCTRSANVHHTTCAPKSRHRTGHPHTTRRPRSQERTKHHATNLSHDLHGRRTHRENATFLIYQKHHALPKTSCRQQACGHVLRGPQQWKPRSCPPQEDDVMLSYNKNRIDQATGTSSIDTYTHPQDTYTIGVHHTAHNNRKATHTDTHREEEKSTHTTENLQTKQKEDQEYVLGNRTHNRNENI